MLLIKEKHGTIKQNKPMIVSPFFFRSFSFLPLFLGVMFWAGLSPVQAETPLSEEALANLVKPSVVRIAEHVTGTAKIPAVKVDIRQHLVAAIPDRFTEVPVDEYLSGSGFIIHPDGYIATNAHVVSLETIKTTLAGESALSAIFENALLLNDQEMQEFLQGESSEQFTKDIVHYIIDHSTFDLKNQVAVLRPGSVEPSMEKLITSGFPAEVIAVNEQFLDDERDVALLKIEEQNLPALSLGDAETLSVGKKVFIFGFPATAEINGKSPSEATFTRGVVSAIRQSLDGKLKIFQTDAKVSQGSSGGPLFDDTGEVLGVITFQTDELSRSAGDNFAFALPITLVKEEALNARIMPEEGTYSQAFKAGFAAFTEKHCDKALSSFAEAKKTNPLFLSDVYMGEYEQKCRQWQSEGQSRDTYWDEFRDGVSTLSNPMLYVVGGGLLSFGVLGAMMFWLLRQLRREEKEIDLLEDRIRVDEEKLRHHEMVAAKKKFPEAEAPLAPKKRI